MFYKGEPLYKVVFEFIKSYTGNEVVDEEQELDELGVSNDDMFQFTFAVAEHFGFDEYIDGDEIGDYASVYNVVNFIEDYL